MGHVLFKPDNTRVRLFLIGFKISDMDHLILALIFIFGVILVLKKLDVKFSRVFIRYKETHYTLISFVFSLRSINEFLKAL